MLKNTTRRLLMNSPLYAGVGASEAACTELVQVNAVLGSQQSHAHRSNVSCNSRSGCSCLAARGGWQFEELLKQHPSVQTRCLLLLLRQHMTHLDAAVAAVGQAVAGVQTAVLAVPGQAASCTQQESDRAGDNRKTYYM